MKKREVDKKSQVNKQSEQKTGYGNKKLEGPNRPST